MRISSISAKGVMPIREFAVTDLSDVIVLAGSNGVGKTRLLEWLIQFLRSIPPGPENWITVEATSQAELKAWGKNSLDTRQPQDADSLRSTLQQNKKRSGQKSSLLVFESNRSISQVKPYGFTWDMVDPDDEMVGWDFGFGFLKDRFTDTQHSIFRRIRSRRDKMAFTLEGLIKEKELDPRDTSKLEDKSVEFDYGKYPDPMEPFQAAFSQLLAPKELLDPDVKGQNLNFSDGVGQYPITQLSSGEREVVNIVFDFILRNPQDCIVIFDEPELHLHPELSYKLIQTLRSVGARNQFIFCTHSAEIISASLENSVIFVAPPREGGGNQAVPMREDDVTFEALRLIGQSIGVVSLGRKIVLIEGEHASLDKQTYGAILRNRYPNLVLAPSGGKDVIRSFSALCDKVIDKTLWGIEFFMLCDRDALSPIAQGASDALSNQRLRQLPRYHLENYFLDEEIISEIFANLEPTTSWLRNPTAIQSRLAEIAAKQISYAASLVASKVLRENVGNVDLMPKGVHNLGKSDLIDAIIQKAELEFGRVQTSLTNQKIDTIVSKIYDNFIEGLSDGNWKFDIPGRPVLKMFCNEVSMDFGRFKMAYINTATSLNRSVFQDIDDIFLGFSAR